MAMREPEVKAEVTCRPAQVSDTGETNEGEQTITKEGKKQKQEVKPQNTHEKSNLQSKTGSKNIDAVIERGTLKTIIIRL